MPEADVATFFSWFAATPRTAVELKKRVGGNEPDYRWARVRHHAPFLRVDGDWVAAQAWLTQPFGDRAEGTRHLLRRYLAIAHKRRALLFTTVGLSLLIAVLINYTTRPVYQAKVQILIDKAQPTVALCDPVRSQSCCLTTSTRWPRSPLRKSISIGV